jgi:hypothetical protein
VQVREAILRSALRHGSRVKAGCELQLLRASLAHGRGARYGMWRCMNSAERGTVKST